MLFARRRQESTVNFATKATLVLVHCRNLTTTATMMNRVKQATNSVVVSFPVVVAVLLAAHVPNRKCHRRRHLTLSKEDLVVEGATKKINHAFFLQ